MEVSTVQPFPQLVKLLRAQEIDMVRLLYRKRVEKDCSDPYIIKDIFGPFNNEDPNS